MTLYPDAAPSPLEDARERHQAEVAAEIAEHLLDSYATLSSDAGYLHHHGAGDHQVADHLAAVLVDVDEDDRATLLTGYYLTSLADLTAAANQADDTAMWLDDLVERILG